MTTSSESGPQRRERLADIEIVSDRTEGSRCDEGFLRVRRLILQKGIAKPFTDSLLAAYSGEEEKSFTGFSAEVRGIFAVYPWPGNVRQLQNVIRNMVVLNDGEEITPDMLPSPLDEFIGKASPISSADWANVIHNKNRETDVSPSESIPTNETGILPLDESEREIIERAIDVCDGNVPKAAARLEISASTIYRKRQAWEEKQKKTA